MEKSSNKPFTVCTCGVAASHYTQVSFDKSFRPPAYYCQRDMEAAASNNPPMGCTQAYFDKPLRQPVFRSMKNIQIRLSNFQAKMAGRRNKRHPISNCWSRFFSLCSFVILFNVGIAVENWGIGSVMMTHGLNMENDSQSVNLCYKKKVRNLFNVWLNCTLIATAPKFIRLKEIFAIAA